ncbi:hypothetical protein [Variovorax ginsengisoli]|uniref:Uncharacterized protein n=1 Tax=Variovorax ginsengisoli TaxID=363844 RepID=A0ABT9S6T2_9BURK|nr:hypothetical protein [Variovorax ginsengisoli]MDP9900074.1 hypothetical protein [Variovorax ginsengisoli]
MSTNAIRRAAAVGFAALVPLFAGGVLAQSQPAQPVQARVIATTPMTDASGRTSYNVTYEYAGRQYTTRTDSPPGATLPIDVNAYGVATLPVAPQGDVAPERYDARQDPRDDRAAWQNVVPEPGVVVSPGAAPAVTYAPAPVYYYAPPPAPVYVQPAYAYPAPYAYAPAFFPPIGLSLNLGYSRGWGGHRGWR